MKSTMAIMDYKWWRWRSCLLVFVLCFDRRIAQESDAAKKCEEIKIGELIV